MPVQNVPVQNGPIAWPAVLISQEPLIQTTLHSTLQFLGSSAIHLPVQCPFRACSERADKQPHTQHCTSLGPRQYTRQ